MGLTLTSTGKLFSTTFPGTGMPTGFHSAIEGGSITINNGATIVDPGNCGCIYSETEVTSKIFVVRTKAKVAANPTGACSHLMMELIDLASCPTQYFSDTDNSGDGRWNSPRRKDLLVFGDGYNNNWDLIMNMSDTTNRSNLLHPGVEGTDYIWEFNSNATNLIASLRSSTDLSLIGGASLTWGTSDLLNPSDKLWLCIGSPVNNCFWINSNNVHAYFQAFKSANVTATGLATGNACRLYKANNTLIASAVESSGIVTLDATLVEFPLDGYIDVYEDDGYDNLLTTIASSDIWGGDEYVYSTGSPGAGYSITAQADETAAPNTWTLWGSDDGADWTLIDTQTDIVFTTGEKKTFAADVAYTHIKIDVTKTNGASFYDIHELSIER